jgi:hypothetical protein
MKAFTPRDWRITFRIDQTEGEILDLDYSALIERRYNLCRLV